eukprot:jgi/Phyca11/105031/e_gw1.10.486.1
MLVVEIPNKLEKQRQLLVEAMVEPLLWRPHFSAEKYRRVLEISHGLLNNNYLLFKLLRWFHFRVTQNRVKLHPGDIRDEIDGTDDVDSHTKWKLSTSHFQSLIRDNFETMEMIFCDAFCYSDPDQTAVFMQMKEAFRLADKDCSGELNADDVAVMIESIFSQSGAVKEEQIKQYVQEFMDVVGKPGRTTVSFEDFMYAIEHGLKLEVEVRRRRASTLQCGNLPTKLEENLPETRQTANELPLERENHGTSIFTSENASIFIRHEYDVLNIADFTTSEVVAHMKAAYAEWLLTDNRFERTSMEEQLLLNCLVSGAASVAKSLSALEEVAMSS